MGRMQRIEMKCNLLKVSKQDTNYGALMNWDLQMRLKLSKQHGNIWNENRSERMLEHYPFADNVTIT